MNVRFKETEVEVSISGFVRTVGCESHVDFPVEPNGYFRIAMGNKGLVKFFDQADAIVEIENKYPEKMDYLQNVDPRVSPLRINICLMCSFSKFTYYQNLFTTHRFNCRKGDPSILSNESHKPYSAFYFT